MRRGPARAAADKLSGTSAGPLHQSVGRNLRVDVQLRPDGAEHVADAATRERETTDRDERHERNDECVLDERLTLFVAKIEAGPNVRQQHLRLLEHAYLLR